MTWCLHKGAAWCSTHGEFEVDLHIEVTTYADLGAGREMFICRACGGRKAEYLPPWEEPKPCHFGTMVPTAGGSGPTPHTPGR